MQRRILALTISSIVLLSGAACGDDGDDTPENSDTDVPTESTTGDPGTNPRGSDAPAGGTGAGGGGTESEGSDSDSGTNDDY